MNNIDFYIERFSANPSSSALAWRDQIYSFGWLADDLAARTQLLKDAGIGAGSVAVLRGEYAPVGVSLILALIQLNAITAPLLPMTFQKNPNLIDMINPNFIIDVTDGEKVTIMDRQADEQHPLYTTLIERSTPGLVLFTSGSTGQPKGVVHDFSKLLEKFKTRRGALITLSLLTFDHWGGLNTLLHGLANDSLVVLTEHQTPEYVCEVMERHKVELLPATPSFLNMLLISRAYENRDLSSLKLITYGAEPMPDTTLKNLRRTFPGIEIRQTYGLIELGVLRAKSLSSESLWVKVGGDGYDVRVVNDMLEIKADAAMLGYLNAPSPFTPDGYFMTGDRVEVNGDYLRILGRDSELINVGGQKVYPAEVEAVLLECPDVENVVVFKEQNPIMGQIVCAKINRRSEDGSEREVKNRIKRFCSTRLDAYKVPIKIAFVAERLHSDRMKLLRTWSVKNQS